MTGSSPTGRPPVIADVARLAGVSHQTVSRVLNDQPNVRPETRDRVQAAMRALDYRPDPAARALATRRREHRRDPQCGHRVAANTDDQLDPHCCCRPHTAAEPENR